MSHRFKHGSTIAFVAKARQRATGLVYNVVMRKIGPRLLFLILGVVLLFSFYEFSRLVKRDIFRDLDFAVTVKLQDRISPRFNNLWETATLAANPLISTLTVLLLTGWGIVRTKGWISKLKWLALPAAFFLLILGELYGKSVVHHPAPPFFLIRNPTANFPKYYINEQFSYPSGHAARAVFLAFIVSRVTCHVSRKRKNIKEKILIHGVLLAYVGLVSVSRLVLGHHWLSDVVGGILLGAALSSLVKVVL